MADAQESARAAVSSAALAQELETHLRPATFPVAVKKVAPGEPLPPKAKRPKRDLGSEITICQAIGLARRYGWTLAAAGEDLSCPIAKAAFGFEERLPYYTEGNLANGMYASCLEAGAAMEAALSTWRHGEAQAIVAGPLARAEFEPDVVIVYGNSAQILRLVNAALWEKGGSFKAAFTGRADCTDFIIRTAQTNEPQLVLPCYGDRVFGLAADDELAFSFPFAQGARLLAGLEGTHKGGIRYPVPLFALRAQAQMPKSYVQLEQKWKERKE
jgi:uncharacterized protein (DUF169 family)